MNPIDLAEEIEERYRRYLKTTFYLKDPVLRGSFEEALRSGRLSKGPYIEATPVFKRGATPSSLFRELLGFDPEPGFLEAVQSERPLYRHQEKAIRAVFEVRNAVVATGTGSGKTESFLYPILLHLYQEFCAGTLGSGVRALVLYPMNALANDHVIVLGLSASVWWMRIRPSDSLSASTSAKLPKMQMTCGVTLATTLRIANQAS